VARVALGLGSNLGDRRARLSAAVRRLRDAGPIVAVSSLYETAPVGGPAQGSYLNAVMVVDTALAPRRLLELCQAAEQEAGRRHRVRWGPRSLDVDLLLYEGTVVDERGLRVPHPRLTVRRFALEPLVEAWPEAVLPDGEAAASLLPSVAGQEAQVVAGPGWWEERG
jgi:2-amino-4-hydroxy-6-hydroxymethyldihydropteridine diphosphokinase